MASNMSIISHDHAGVSDLMTEFKFWLNAILSPMSLFLNFILFFLIKYKSSKNLNDYKKVLYLGWITDSSFAFWNMLFEPDLTTSGPIYFMFTRGLLGYLPFPWTAWTFPVTIFLIYFTLVNVPIQFIYRYLLICRKITLNLIAFLFLLSIGLGVVLSYVYFFVYYLITRIENDQSYAYLLNGTVWEIDGEIPYFGAFPIVSFANGFYISYSIVIISYLIVIFCGIEIFRKIYNSSEFQGDKSLPYQKQISIVMTVEAIIPFITVGFPILLDLTTVLLKTPIVWAGKIVFLFCAFSPVINPLVKIFIISCYRRTILRIVFRRNRINGTTQTSQPSGSNKWIH